MAVPRPVSPDLLNRKVLFAVELVDPITHSLVSRDVEVRPAGIQARPIVSWSGRLVWLEEGDAWPGTIAIDPGRLPYERTIVTPPPRPPDLETVPPAGRLVRVLLRPTSSYAFDDGVTVVRGIVRETSASNAPPVAGARLQLAWADDQGTWRPAPPSPEAIDETAPDAPSPREPQTDTNGAFAAFLRLRPPAGVLPDVDARSLVKVRLQVTRGRSSPSTRVTPDDFRFLAPPDDPDDSRRGRVREGAVLNTGVSLAWSELTPV